MDLERLDWPEVLTRHGIAAEFLTKKNGPCPLCGGRDRFSFDQKFGRGSYYCRGCGAGDGITLLSKHLQMSPGDVLRMLREDGTLPTLERPFVPFNEGQVDTTKMRKKLQETWDASQPLAPNDPVSKYLANRVPYMDMRTLSSDIRHHPSLDLWDARDRTKKPILVGRFHAMLARVRNAEGKPISIHRTYLTAHGEKAPVDADLVKKQMTGTERLAGGAIRLTGLAGETIGVAEGIETAAACVTAARNRLPVWAVLNANNLAKFVWPASIKKLVIFEDHDLPDARGRRAGQENAAKLEKRAKAAGIEVVRKTPPNAGEDFCDIWKSMCMVKKAA